ncbi:MAG: hypothetical protein PGN13_01635 [Patulibacter minatonensis]
MAKRGFFAEIHHQNQLAAKRREQELRARSRAHQAAVREAERTRKQAERAAAQLARATAAEQKQAEREAKRFHEEARLAEADFRNAALAETIDELDSILAATLDVDDYVDLESFRTVVAHPPFPRKDLEVGLPKPVRGSSPEAPKFVEPPAPTGIGKLMGGRKKHEEAIAQARAVHEDALASWQAEVDALPARLDRDVAAWELAESERRRELLNARNAYEAECKRNDQAADAANAQLDALISGLAAGEDEAIEEYIGIVLGNSVYPQRLAVEHEFTFDRELGELELTVLIGPPSIVPDVKVYRYVKSKDEIAATPATKKDMKERYASVVAQVALRTLHEVFEADREGKIGTIALVVATEANDPATGVHQRANLAAVGAARETFLTFDLNNVVPLATLQHLGAAVSKNPFELKTIDGAPGVRSR